MNIEFAGENMEKRYAWYICLVLWLPNDALMKVVLFGFMKPSRACLRCSQMTGRVDVMIIMLLDLAGLTQQGQIQTPGTGASLSSQASPGAFL